MWRKEWRVTRERSYLCKASFRVRVISLWSQHRCFSKFLRALRRCLPWYLTSTNIRVSGTPTLTSAKAFNTSFFPDFKLFSTNLELRKVHIQSAVKPERSGDRGHNLAYQAIQIAIRGAPDVKVSATDVVDSLVIHHESAVRVLQGSMSGENRIVGLYHCRWYLKYSTYKHHRIGKKVLATL